MSPRLVRLVGGPCNGATHCLLSGTSLVVCDTRPTLGKETVFHHYKPDPDDNLVFRYDFSEPTIVVCPPK